MTWRAPPSRADGVAQARENAAGALWHLALASSNQSAIAKCNGIAPLVTILDDGTERGTPRMHRTEEPLPAAMPALLLDCRS